MYTKPDLLLKFVAGYTAHCAYWDLINEFSFLLQRAKIPSPSAIHLSPQRPGASGQALDQLHVYVGPLTQTRITCL